MIVIEHAGGKFLVKDQSSIDLLRKGHFGNMKKDVLILSPEEALYIIDMRNGECLHRGAKLSFNDIAIKFSNAPKFTARYFTYKDWRDRGLVIKEAYYKTGQQSRAHIKEYPRSELKMPRYSLKGVFFKSDLVTIIDQSEKAKDLYNTLWIGQYGSYKASDRGKLNKLDIYETLLLISKGVLEVQNTSKREILRIASERRRDFQQLYGVYSDWRNKGYVIKTGFKFGTHFRVYFPGARPMSEGNQSWVHSKHVIHVFPKESKLLISEWARAIRVAHSVRKTFILAVPGASKAMKMHIDYVLYHRKGGNAEDPEADAPRYAMLSLSEEEFMGGSEFAAAIKEAKERKLELIVAIADRETSVTYYKVRQIRLKGSYNEYYEIDWMQP
jgi:tRNA-intron endonuclease, archaea type